MSTAEDLESFSLTKKMLKDDQRREQLRLLSRALQDRYHPILVSNRGPVELRADADGHVSGRRGAGGVVTALTALSSYLKLTWVAAAMSDGEREVVKQLGNQIPWLLQGNPVHLRLVAAPRAVYRRYYNVFANPFLWFLQHYLLNIASDAAITAETYNAWSRGYVPMNKAIADAVVAAARNDRRTPLVLLQDYHLYLAGGFVREQCPEATLLHFVHIPWPSARYWLMLPEEMRQAIWRSLTVNDIVGFQTEHDVHNFLRGCEVFLPEARVDYASGSVTRGGHQTQVKAYPISVDVAALRQLARSRRVRKFTEGLRAQTSDYTIMRVDRMEPSKNIVRGFEAYDLLLEQHRELRERVRFLAFLVPSRTNLPEYRQYYSDVRSIIQAVNEKYGTPTWKPIEMFYENNYAQAIAAMGLYDVLLVNAVIDGMNLVAKEGPTVNTRDGVLVLTEGIGAHAELKEHALTVAAPDVVGAAKALYQALMMPLPERRLRAEGLRRTIATNDLTHWLDRQLRDVSLLDEPRLRLLPAS